MKRDRAYRRYMNYIKAKRKRDINAAIAWDGYLWYNNLHQYSKNAIHCSCGMCSRYNKTNNKGKRRRIRGNYALSYNPNRRDKRRNDSMKEQLNSD